MVAGQAWGLNFQSNLLEKQLKAIEHEQKSLANNIIKNGVRKAESAGKLLQASSSVQKSVGDSTADKGINDVNIALNKIFSSDDQTECD